MEKLFSYLSASSFFSPFPEEIIAFIQPKDTSNTYREKDTEDDTRCGRHNQNKQGCALTMKNWL